MVASRAVVQMSFMPLGCSLLGSPLALLLYSIRVTCTGNGLQAIRLSRLTKVRSCLLGEKVWVPAF